jgi:hypothetical protein
VTDALERIDWRAAEPGLLAREREEMARRAPAMELLAEPHAGVWRGLAPGWPTDLEPLEGLDRLLEGRRLLLEVGYTQGFPMAPPIAIPLDPVPAVELRARHAWHLNGDGSLCLLWSAADWPGTGTAADLVEKASGWFVEYLALLAGLINAMSQSGPFYCHPELAEKLRSL